MVLQEVFEDETPLTPGSIRCLDGTTNVAVFSPVIPNSTLIHWNKLTHQ